MVSFITAFLYWGLAQDFEAEHDDLLLQRTQALKSLLRKGLTAELQWEVETEWEHIADRRIYVRISNTRGKTFLESPKLDHLLPVRAIAAANGVEQPLRAVRANAPSGRPFRVMTATAAGAEPGDQWVIQTALDISSEMAVLKKYRILLSVVLASSALISLGLGYRITRGGLRPLTEIVETTRRIRSSTLSERVHRDHLPVELASLADNFNEMLKRLEDSFTRLSRLSADLAHELRTPLNVLRGETEVALSKPRSVEEYREVLVSSLEEYAYLARILESLLFIAHAETSATTVERERVNVAAELRYIAEYYEPIAVEKKITFEVDSDREICAAVDRMLFRRAVSNLVSNALAYTLGGGSISLSATEQESNIRVQVSDTGIGIAREHLAHVFDRFYRVDRARPRASGGVGLGLSIVKTIMDLHSGSAELASQPGAGTRVTLVFPRNGFS